MNKTDGAATAEPGIVKKPPDAVQPGSNVFFLEQVLGYDADKETIVYETARRYPPDLFVGNGNPYILVDIGQRHPPHRGGILSAKTKNFIGYNSLDEFVRRIESAGKGVIVSFGQADFDTFSDAVMGRTMWGTRETYHQGNLYAVHKYDNPALRANR